MRLWCISHNTHILRRSKREMLHHSYSGAPNGKCLREPCSRAAKEECFGESYAMFLRGSGSVALFQ